MKFERFTAEHISAAMEIARANYEEERAIVTALPEDMEIWDDLGYFAEAGLGVAAMEDGKLQGYLTFCKPWEGAFDMYDGLGTFSPLHAHGAVKENRSRLYQDMYAWIGEVLAEQKIVGTGIALYAHDEAAKYGLFEYGFGMRCKDQIRRITGNEFVTTFGPVETSGLTFEELRLEDFPLISDMRHSLNNHLKSSPCFMQSTEEEFQGWLQKVLAGDRRTFVAKKDGKIAAYVDIAEDGENFVGDHPLMRNIQGAYCSPDYRGQQIYQKLVLYVSDLLYAEGFRYLGVDHESYNPTANRFWSKLFTEYTNSVTRKIEVWSRE